LSASIAPPALFCGVGEVAAGIGVATVGLVSIPVVVLLDVLVVLVAIAVSL
jgi:hypothetical protein